MLDRRTGLWQATLTLLAGGALAHALPLLLGPWLTRLYTPAEFGQFTAFSVLAANLAVLACARYEFALPLARDDAEAGALFALCLRILAVVVGACAVLALGLHATGAIAHAGWLPLAVGAAGLLSLMTLWATRAQAFTALAATRVLQHGGGALLQVALALGSLGVLGLILGPVLATLLAAAWLWRATPHGGVAAARSASWRSLRPVMCAHQDFPLLNTPHAFLGALGDTLAVMILVAWSGDAAAGLWGLTLRYLKAPATLVGGAVSQALYPRLSGSSPAEARRAVRQVMVLLGAVGLAIALLLVLTGPALFAAVFGEPWRPAGELARALAPYIALHFVASPLAVVTMAWGAQAWALRLALAGQSMFLAALAGGLAWGGLEAAGWAVSAAMALYFGWYFVALATWKLTSMEHRVGPAA
ncbi:MAG TPA: oligosaccharide flippase family protein [Ideonella sp.]|nr:oligosaccharide flippase family protein [Ideonella sp.]